MFLEVRASDRLLKAGLSGPSATTGLPVTQPPYGILISEEAPAAPAVAPGQERPSPRWEAPPPACTPFTIIIDFSKYQI